MMSDNLYFEGSETFFADMEWESGSVENIENAVWVSQR